MVLENALINDVMANQKRLDTYLIFINESNPIEYFSKYRVIPRTG
jgi:hypothetical protein